MRDFEADRRICDAATKGPWKVGVGIDAECDECGETVSYSAAIIRRECNDFGICDVFVDDNDAENAAFIAAARDGWPAALDWIAELETACQKYSLAIRILDNKNAELLQKTQQVDELLQKAQRLEELLQDAVSETECGEKLSVGFCTAAKKALKEWRGEK